MRSHSSNANIMIFYIKSVLIVIGWMKGQTEGQMVYKVPFSKKTLACEQASKVGHWMKRTGTKAADSE